MSYQENRQEEIKNYKERLQKIRERIATQGSSIDPSVEIEAKKIEEKIKELESKTPSDTSQPPLTNLRALFHNLELKCIVKFDVNQLFEDFTPEMKERFLTRLAIITGVTITVIKLLEVIPGSIILIMEMPLQAANRLLKLHENNDPLLKKLNITTVEIIQDATELTTQATKVIKHGDRPIDDNKEDYLYMNPQVESLKWYITDLKSHEKPFTIAICGEWGTGKTSFFNLLQRTFRQDNKNLNLLNDISYQTNDYQFIEIQAWKFTTVDSLWLELMGEIIDKLCPQSKHSVDIEDKNKYRQTLNYLWRGTTDSTCAKLQKKKTLLLPNTLNRSPDASWQLKPEMMATALFTAILSIAGTYLPFFKTLQSASGLDNVEFSADQLFQKTTPQKTNEVIEKFDQEVVEVIKNKLEQQNLNLIVFIDDLDRFPPDKALDFLEDISVYLQELPLIFILAIDKDIIAQGLRLRYKDVVEETNNESSMKHFFKEMGQAYLEKLIQLFVPISQRTSWQVHQFIEGRFPHWILVSDIIQVAIGFNPRKLRQHCESLLYGYIVYKEDMSYLLKLEKVNNKRPQPFTDYAESLFKVTDKLKMGKLFGNYKIFREFIHSLLKEYLKDLTHTIFKPADNFDTLVEIAQKFKFYKYLYNVVRKVIKQELALSTEIEESHLTKQLYDALPKRYIQNSLNDLTTASLTTRIKVNFVAKEINTVIESFSHKFKKYTQLADDKQTNDKQTDDKQIDNNNQLLEKLSEALSKGITDKKSLGEKKPNQLNDLQQQSIRDFGSKLQKTFLENKEVLPIKELYQQLDEVIKDTLSNEAISNYQKELKTKIEAIFQEEYTLDELKKIKQELRQNINASLTTKSKLNKRIDTFIKKEQYLKEEIVQNINTTFETLSGIEAIEDIQEKLKEAIDKAFNKNFFNIVQIWLRELKYYFRKRFISTKENISIKESIHEIIKDSFKQTFGLGLQQQILQTVNFVFTKNTTTDNEKLHKELWEFILTDIYRWNHLKEIKTIQDNLLNEIDSELTNIAYNTSNVKWLQTQLIQTINKFLAGHPNLKNANLLYNTIITQILVYPSEEEASKHTSDVIKTVKRIHQRVIELYLNPYQNSFSENTPFDEIIQSISNQLKQIDYIVDKQQNFIASIKELATTYQNQIKQTKKLQTELLSILNNKQPFNFKRFMKGFVKLTKLTNYKWWRKDIDIEQLQSLAQAFNSHRTKMDIQDTVESTIQNRLDYLLDTSDLFASKYKQFITNEQRQKVKEYWYGEINRHGKGLISSLKSIAKEDSEVIKALLIDFVDKLKSTQENSKDDSKKLIEKTEAIKTKFATDRSITDHANLLIDTIEKAQKEIERTRDYSDLVEQFYQKYQPKPLEPSVKQLIKQQVKEYIKGIFVPIVELETINQLKNELNKPPNPINKKGLTDIIEKLINTEAVEEKLSTEAVEEKLQSILKNYLPWMNHEAKKKKDKIEAGLKGAIKEKMVKLLSTVFEKETRETLYEVLQNIVDRLLTYEEANKTITEITPFITQPTLETAWQEMVWRIFNLDSISQTACDLRIFTKLYTLDLKWPNVGALHRRQKGLEILEQFQIELVQSITPQKDNYQPTQNNYQSTSPSNPSANNNNHNNTNHNNTRANKPNKFATKEINDLWESVKDDEQLGYFFSRHPFLEDISDYDFEIYRTSTSSPILIQGSISKSDVDDLIEQAQKKKSKKLDLSQHNLPILPEELFDLTQLRELDLSHTNLQYLPDEIRDLEYLKDLDMPHNQLEELPSSIFDMARGNLTELDLRGNPIKLTAYKIGLLLTNLDELYLDWENYRDKIFIKINEPINNNKRSNTMSSYLENLTPDQIKQHLALQYIIAYNRIKGSELNLSNGTIREIIDNNKKSKEPPNNTNKWFKGVDETIEEVNNITVTSISAELWDAMSEVEDLDLTGNQLEVINLPKEEKGKDNTWTKLNKLTLSDNKLAALGKIEEKLTTLLNTLIDRTRFKELILQSNEFTEIPEPILALNNEESDKDKDKIKSDRDKVRIIDMTENPLSTIYPAQVIGKLLSKLKDFKMDGKVWQKYNTKIFVELNKPDSQTK